MTQVSFALLSIAVALGAFLLAGRLWRAALAHGAFGLTGLAALAAALWRGQLAGPFAWDALALAAAAALAGIAIYALSRRRRARPGLLVGLHALAGGLAYLLLAGFAFGR